MSLLSLVQQVTARLSLPTPASVVNSVDPNVLLLFGLANEEGVELASTFDWQALTEECTFVTLNQEVQTSGLPSDLDRVIPNTSWNRTTNRPLIGPISPQAWQRLMAFPSISLPDIAFRTRGSQFLTYPSPPGGQTIAFEYVSINWTESEAGSPMPAYTADTDAAMLPETLMALGVRWRFLKSKGLDYAEDFRTYEEQKARAQARDGGSSVLSVSYPDDSLLASLQVPEGNFPGP